MRLRDIVTNFMLGMNYRWFDRDRKRIVTGHEGEYALVSGRKLWGYYKTRADCIRDASLRGFVRGRYMVHQCFFEEPVYRVGF